MTLPSISIAASKPNRTPPPKAKPDFQPAVVLFGRGTDAKPHGAAFSEADAALARKAATLMGLNVVEASAKGVGELASRLPRGRVFASGKAFAPFLSAPTYTALLAATGVSDTQPSPLKRKKASASESKDDEPAASPKIYALPKSWSELKPDCLALASEGEGHAWYEVIILEARGDGLYICRWRDSPELDPFPRHRDHLGLLPAGYVQPGQPTK